MIPTGSTIPPLATDSKKLRNLEDEVDKLKQLLIEQREQNKKLQTLVEGYKRFVNNECMKPNYTYSQLEFEFSSNQI